MASEVTIDWCEANYAVTPFVAEFWNTLTSLLCMIPPLVWFVQRFPEGVGMIPWVYPLISFIMFGSVMFHGTLTWVGQLLDEVPILAFISFSFSTLFDSYSIRGGSSKDASVMQRSWWGPGPRALALVGVLQVSAITLLYTTRAKAYGLFLGCAIVQALAHWPLMLLEMCGRLREVRGPMLRMLAVHVALGYGGYAAVVSREYILRAAAVLAASCLVASTGDVQPQTVYRPFDLPPPLCVRREATLRAALRRLGPIRRVWTARLSGIPEEIVDSLK
eukprot:CAMPEP_0183434492 /NCGR_PEP_ID=MMETSP0370-20130417/63329_1 /TAXON_ID=268820 /ORGANISM="Peridinium aciculiferum, Strain PAER-2" /LENGTH=275 /DNA_ID=CAMNT_0025621175 /DNA_START=60 /DNA_END=883 /DNA_ORIENTATION=+